MALGLEFLSPFPPLERGSHTETMALDYIQKESTSEPALAAELTAGTDTLPPRAHSCSCSPSPGLRCDSSDLLTGAGLPSKQAWLTGQPTAVSPALLFSLSTSTPHPSERSQPHQQAFHLWMSGSEPEPLPIFPSRHRCELPFPSRREEAATPTRVVPQC